MTASILHRRPDGRLGVMDASEVEHAPPGTLLIARLDLEALLRALPDGLVAQVVLPMRPRPANIETPPAEAV